MKREVSKFKNATFATQIIKKHPLDVPQEKPHSQKLYNTHRKTPSPESLYNKFSDRQACNLSKRDAKAGAPSRTAKSPRTSILKNTFEPLPLIIDI